MPEDESSLERIHKLLYAQEAPAPVVPPPLSHRSAHSSATETEWQAPPPKPKIKKRFSWSILFLAVAAVFFVVAIGVSIFLVVIGSRSVSSNNIVITVQGPANISSGANVPLTVTIVNKNPVAISGTDISMAFPDGTRSADDVTQPLVRYVDTLGSIPAGGSVSRTVQAVLFGSVNQSESIPITFQYRTANSNALFVKQYTYVYTVTSSPLSITAQPITNVSSGQPFTINLTVRSNSATPLTNIAVAGQYPASGFAVQSVQISPAQAASSTSTMPFFILGTLAPGEQRTIAITGTLTGTENDQQNFQFTVGTMKTDGTQGIEIPYATESSDVTLAKPFLGVTLSLNHGDTDPTVVTSGESISGLLTWVNTLASSLSNAQILIKLTGNALDPSTVTTATGYYDSSSNTISFTPQTLSSLQLLNAGSSGTGAFTLSTKTGAAFDALRNPTIQLAVSVEGQPVGSGAEVLTNTLVNTIRVATNLQLTSRILYSTGPFKNSGAWPPVPNQPTTYTVELAASNTVNPVAGATATMILPAYVTFTGAVTPNDGSIKYDSNTNTVTWNIGDVPAGAGSATPVVSAAFQISFTPSVTQSQTSPVLVGNQTLTGTDRFTNSQVGGTAPALTTQTSTDPAYQQSFGTVGN